MSPAECCSTWQAFCRSTRRCGPPHPSGEPGFPSPFLHSHGTDHLPGISSLPKGRHRYFPRSFSALSACSVVNPVPLLLHRLHPHGADLVLGYLGGGVV